MHLRVCLYDKRLSAIKVQLELELFGIKRDPQDTQVIFLPFGYNHLASFHRNIHTITCNTKNDKAYNHYKTLQKMLNYRNF